MNLSTDSNWKDHTFGTYWRLFLHEVLPPEIKQIIYIDTDVIVMNNLMSLWKERRSSVLFVYGKRKCAGLMIFNVAMLHKLWDYFPDATDAKDMVTRVFAPVTRARGLKPMKIWPNDQGILTVIKQNHPRLVRIYADYWDYHLANGVWAFAHDLVKKAPNGVGMLHMNGGGVSPWWTSPKKARMLRHDGMHQLKYFIDMPWSWLRGKMKIRSAGHENPAYKGPPGGFSFVFLHRAANLSLLQHRNVYDV